MFFSDCAPKKGFIVAVTSKSTIKNRGRKKVLIFSPVVSLNASVVPLLPASSSCSLADLLFLMYLEKYFQKTKKLQNIFFGLLYYGFIFNLLEFMLFLFWTEAENNSIPQVNAQMVFTKGSGICGRYLKMQPCGTLMCVKGKGVCWRLAGEKRT